MPMTNMAELGRLLFGICLVFATKYVTGEELTDVSGRIIPTNEAKENEFPFTVYLDASTSGSIYYPCTGTLIDRRWVLTSARCFGSKSTVVAGVYDRTTGGESKQIRDIDTVYIHPNFTNPYGYHVALVRLSSPFAVREDAVSTIPLLRSKSFQSKMLNGEKQCRLLGWGGTRTDGVWDYSKRLNQQRIGFVQDAEVSARGYTLVDGNFNIEALYEDKCRVGSTCLGDGGGPVICKKGGQWILTGFYDFGLFYDGCITGVKSAVDVFHNIDWIDSYIN